MHANVASLQTFVYYICLVIFCMQERREVNESKWLWPAINFAIGAISSYFSGSVKKNM